MEGAELHSIIQRCIRGERPSQKRIFDMFSAKMMTVCLRYTRNIKDAEDVLQDGFVKVYSSLDQFAFKGSFEGWVRRIFVHTALRYIEKRKRNVELNERTLRRADDEGAQDAGISILNFETEKDRTKQIIRLISLLPDGYRNIFNLYVFEGFDHGEIATILKISASTSRSQLSKARKVLQKEIIKYKLI